MDSKEKYLYWEDIAQYDLDTANAMFQSGRYLYVVFMCQQSIEKLVKGLYVLYKGEEPPRTHNIWLVIKKLIQCEDFNENLTYEFSGTLELCKPFFAELLSYYISERYPSYREKLSSVIKKEKAESVLKDTKEVFVWLQSLSK